MARKVLKNKYPLKAIDVTKETYAEYSNFTDIEKCKLLI